MLTCPSGNREGKGEGAWITRQPGCPYCRHGRAEIQPESAAATPAALSASSPIGIVQTITPGTVSSARTIG